MNSNTVELTFIAHTVSSIRDEILSTCTGAYSLDAAVQIDVEYINDAIELNIISAPTVEIFRVAMGKYPNTTIFQFY